MRWLVAERFSFLDVVVGCMASLYLAEANFEAVLLVILIGTFLNLTLAFIYRSKE